MWHAFSQAQTEKPAKDLMRGCGDDRQHMTLRAATSQLLSFFSVSFFFFKPIICQKSALCHLRLIRQAGRYVQKTQPCHLHWGKLLRFHLQEGSSLTILCSLMAESNLKFMFYRHRGQQVGLTAAVLRQTLPCVEKLHLVWV